MAALLRGLGVLALSAVFAACGGGDSGATGSGGHAGAGGGGGGTTAAGGAANGGGSSGGNAGSGATTACNGEPNHTGDGTYYTFADGSGNCGFDPTPNDLMVGAMNHTDYADSAVCGACAHLVGPSGEVTVRIVDQCPECKPGDIDLSPEAFAKLADISLGRVTINWKYVPCDVTGPIVYHFKDGVSQWWTAVQIRNHRNAIAKFEYQKSDGSFAAVNRVSYNYFVEDAGMGPGPYTFRVTDVYGNQLTDSGIALVVNADAPGAAQFPACK